MIKLVILFKKLGNLPLILVGSLLRWYSHQRSTKTFVNGVSHTAFLSRQSVNKSVQRGRIYVKAKAETSWKFWGPIPEPKGLRVDAVE